MRDGLHCRRSKNERPAPCGGYWPTWWVRPKNEPTPDDNIQSYRRPESTGRSQISSRCNYSQKRGKSRQRSGSRSGTKRCVLVLTEGRKATATNPLYGSSPLSEGKRFIRLTRGLCTHDLGTSGAALGHFQVCTECGSEVFVTIEGLCCLRLSSALTAYVS